MLLGLKTEEDSAILITHYNTTYLNPQFFLKIRKKKHVQYIKGCTYNFSETVMSNREIRI